MPDPAPPVIGPQPAPARRLLTSAEWTSQVAREAWEQGCAALAHGDVRAAIRWLERACRYAPKDLTPKLPLASAWLAAGHDEAASLFEDVAAAAELQEAWLGAAFAHERAGRPEPAAAALHRALCRHAGSVPPERADRIARAAGFAGWCGVSADGRLVLRGEGRALQVPGLADGLAVTVRDGDPVPEAGRLTLRPPPALLGSPLDLAEIRRTEGFVAVAEGGLRGWAWHPGDPARNPTLTVRSGARRLALVAAEPGDFEVRAFSRARGFIVTAAALAGFADPISVLDSSGRHLTGSPIFLDPPVSTRRRRRAPPQARPEPDRPLVVVVPVFRGASETANCLRQTFRTIPADTVVIVVDDASPEPALVAGLEKLAAAGSVQMLRHAENRGFPAAANTGLRAALALRPIRDVVLLNSDTVPAPHWLARLRQAVHGSDDIGTATPFSNEGSVASYPAEGAPPPGGPALRRLAALAQRANPDETVDLPTGVGFCLYVRHECLAQTGLLREDVFAQGYGEENDFCRRAAAAGWRHVAVPAAYVAHLGGRSFGDARASLLTRNLSVLEQLHPGYEQLVAAWRRADPLAAARRRLDLLRFAATTMDWPNGSVLLVTHDSGGGVERCVQERAAALQREGRRVILLRPVLDRRGTSEAQARRYLPGQLRLQDAALPDDHPNLIFAITDLRLVADVLAATRPAWLEVHHLLGHDHAVLGLAQTLGIPYDICAHDYAAFCPRIVLLGPTDRYCGEPDVAGCEVCVAEAGSHLEETIGPTALRARSAAELAHARAVIVPSADMASRLRRHFPGVAPAILAHEPDPDGRVPARPPSDPCRVVVVGAIGTAKGFDVLLDCARDAAERGLNLTFAVVGHTLDDAALFETGCVEVTGPYREGEAADLIARQHGQVAFIPSIWPETWCFALGEAFAAGLSAVAFDIGAPAERIRRTGRGRLLPLGAPAAAVNNCLLAWPRLAVAANVMHTHHPIAMARS